MIKNISQSVKSIPLLMRTAGVLDNRKVNVQEGVIKGSKKNFRTYYYTPLRENTSNLPGILLVHGMSVYGIEDARLIELARNLSASGYFVATPEFQEIKQLLIREESIENIGDALIGLKKETGLFNRNRLGFFSVSFSGGMGLLSLSGEKIRNEVSSVLVVGPYTDFRETVPFVLGNPNADEYGYFVFLYNFIHLAIKNSKMLEDVLFESALDNGFHRGDKSIAPNLAKNLSKRDKEIFESINKSPAFRMDLGKEFITKKPEIARGLSPIFEIQKIQAHITLIHGRNDNVISAEESIKASRILTEYNRPHVLELTGLLSHGDKVPVHSQLGDVPGIAKAFGCFLANI